MLDRFLDSFEAKWRSAQEPPSMESELTSASELSQAELSELRRELALIDMEQRWRRYYTLHAPSSGDQAALNAAFPKLPTWDDYCRRQACEPSGEGICHEFRVRQAFGDRPDYRDFLTRYETLRPLLSERLPQIAAALTRGQLKLYEGSELVMTCHMPGSVEVGRQRQNEPTAPAMIKTESGHRLLVTELTNVQLSRKRFSLEMIAFQRLWVRHLADKGTLRLNYSTRLAAGESCLVELPCTITFNPWSLRVEG